MNDHDFLTAFLSITIQLNTQKSVNHKNSFKMYNKKNNKVLIE